MKPVEETAVLLSSRDVVVTGVEQTVFDLSRSMQWGPGATVDSGYKCAAFCDALTVQHPLLRAADPLYLGIGWPYVCGHMAMRAQQMGTPAAVLHMLAAAHFS